MLTRRDALYILQISINSLAQACAHTALYAMSYPKNLKFYPEENGSRYWIPFENLVAIGIGMIMGIFGVMKLNTGEPRLIRNNKSILMAVMSNCCFYLSNIAYCSFAMHHIEEDLYEPYYNYVLLGCIGAFGTSLCIASSYSMPKEDNVAPHPPEAVHHPVMPLQFPHIAQARTPLCSGRAS